MAFSNRIFFEYVGSSLLLFILTGCSGNLTSSAPASDDDEFSSSAPIQISGTYLTYDNSKVRCSYEVVGDVYTTTCDAVASVFGFEVVPVGVAEGVSFDWNEPETLKGLGFVESRDCRVENELKQICDLKIPNGNAEFLFNASVSAGHKSKKEDFKMDVAFSVNLIAGQNADLPYYASEQEAQVELKLTSDLNEATQKKAGFNYRSVSAFSGAILNSISDMCTVDSRTYYASEDSIYTVTNDRVELFVSPRRSASADGKISSVLKNCSVQSDCEIKLACGNKGIYVSERSAQALFYLGRNGRASQIDVSSVGLSIGVDAFTPSSMKISKDGTLYVLNNQKSIFKLTGSSLVHIVGGAKPIDYDALSAASLKDLKPTETDFSDYQHRL